MQPLSSSVLVDPRYRVPYAPPAEAGMAWLRASVPRFCDGDLHTRRRLLVDRLLAGIEVVPDPAADPTVVLLAAQGLPPECLDDVDLVAAAYQPHAPQSAEADAAADRLAERCGGRTEATAARLCVLVQAHGALRALREQSLAGRDGPPLPTTRRVGPDGVVREVALDEAPFGAGPHACPGRGLAEAWAASWQGEVAR